MPSSDGSTMPLRLFALLLLAAPALATPQGDAPGGSLAWLVARARAESPELRAAEAGLDASVHREAAAAPFPDPTLGFTAFVRPVETRVGPQQARVSLSQPLPWPGALTAARAMAETQTDEARARRDAAELALVARVARHHWTLWERLAAHATHEEHLAHLDVLAEALRGRVQVGAARLDEVHALELNRARLADALRSLDAQIRAAEAELRAAVALPRDQPLPPLDAPPPPLLPRLDLPALLALAMSHPDLDAARARVEGATAGQALAASQRWPGLSVGADWVLTGPSPMPDVADSGKDALAVGLGLRVPLAWQARAEAVAAAAAGVDQRDAELEQLELARAATVEALWSRLQDEARRALLLADTLLPLAEATHQARLGALAAGRGDLAAALLASADLLALELEADAQRAALARSWAELESLVGQPLERAPVEASSP